MLHPETARLIQEVFAYTDRHDFSTEYESKSLTLAKRDPEACIVSLLQKVKEELPEVSATLYDIIEMGTFEEDVKEARAFLDASTRSLPAQPHVKKSVRGKAKRIRAKAKVAA